MKIRCGNPGTKSVTLSKFDRLRVEFSPTGLATVPEDVGLYLVRHYASIEEVKPKEKKVKKAYDKPVEQESSPVSDIYTVPTADLVMEGEK